MYQLLCKSAQVCIVCVALILFLFNFEAGDEKPTTFELHRSNGDANWELLLKNVVDFGIQGDFLYASVYGNDDPDTVRPSFMLCLRYLNICIGRRGPC